MTKWTLRMRFWRRVHSAVNRLAWRYGGMIVLSERLEPPAQAWLWRLNAWCASGWSKEWLRQAMERRRTWDV